MVGGVVTTCGVLAAQCARVTVIVVEGQCFKREDVWFLVRAHHSHFVRQFATDPRQIDINGFNYTCTPP